MAPEKAQGCRSPAGHLGRLYADLINSPAPSPKWCPSYSGCGLRPSISKTCATLSQQPHCGAPSKPASNECKRMTAPIQQPPQFANAMSSLMRVMGDVLELAREHELAPVQDGVQVYRPEHGKSYFQTAGQFSRPTEFLQTILDLVRIIYEPYPPGTLMLNSNWDFVMDALPSTPYRIGYLSMVSRPGEDIATFTARALATRMTRYGYSCADAVATYFMVTVGRSRSILRTSADVLKQFGAGMTADEALTSIATAVFGNEGGIDRPRRVYAGV